MSSTRVGGRWYRPTVPVRIVVMVVVAALDTAVMALVGVQSVAVAFADWMLSPSHWREKPSAVKVPRPWQMPRATRELYAYHWRKIVRPAPTAPKLSPSEMWP